MNMRPRTGMVIATIVGLVVATAVDSAHTVRASAAPGSSTVSSTTTPRSASTRRAAPTTRPRAAAPTTAVDPLADIDPNELIDCLGGPAALAGAMLGEKSPAPKTLKAQIDGIATWVENERGLKFRSRPVPKFFTPAQLKEKAKALVDKGYPAAEAALDARLLAAYGVVSAQTDMRQLQIDLLGGQIAGFYDTDTGDLVVVSSDQGKLLDPEDQVTLAHELQHALADQALRLPDIDKFPDRQADAALAAQALVEGDATLTMYRYLITQIPLDQMLTIMDSPAVGESAEDLSKYPAYIQRGLLFPYVSGLKFACHLYQQGGWKSVDAAYKKLPKSTAEIRDPALYFRSFAPSDPRDPGKLAGGWKIDRTLGVGEGELLALFGNTRGGIDLKGGEAVQYSDGPRTAVGLSLDGPVCEQTARWYREAFPKDTVGPPAQGERLVVTGAKQAAVLRCNGANVRLGIAPDVASARALVK